MVTGRFYSAAMRRVSIITIACVLAGAACSTQPAGSDTAATALTAPVLAPATVSTITPAADPAVDRPFEVFTPTTYDGTTALPLVVLLHGYGINGEMEEGYLHLQPLAQERGMLLVAPDGTTDADDKHFWNATDACCGFGETNVDDSAYVVAVIEQVRARYLVDPKRIFLVGYSNGGFMSYRMACDHAGTIAAIVSISGATFLDPADCTPSVPVNVLEIHGTDDETIEYGGGDFRGTAYPGAEQSMAMWATYNTCAGTPTASPTLLDLEATIAGAEAVATRYGACPAGGAVELWTIPGGTHVPELSDSFTAAVVDFLLAHPKP